MAIRSRLRNMSPNYDLMFKFSLMTTRLIITGSWSDVSHYPRTADRAGLPTIQWLQPFEGMFQHESNYRCCKLVGLHKSTAVLPSLVVCKLSTDFKIHQAGAANTVIPTLDDSCHRLHMSRYRLVETAQGSREPGARAPGQQCNVAKSGLRPREFRS